MEIALQMFSTHKKSAINEFIKFSNIIEFEQFEIQNKKSAEQISRIIKSEINGVNPQTIKSIQKKERDKIVRRLVLEKGISKSTLERATGILRGIIIRICNSEM